ncbi:hypothetical protein [Nesterenkonia halotolerans]|uniref:GerMN domain-containing protein n=1 Tax=Nesterenkonia halotolerans TaxID=225325 RepID=A0ABR9J629_9MICC|nr:hypothetical protein [Nesterenkonia halotolerans]MBE1514302.1 hypothetical protein [Nesterenkonia halotolerans]
MKTKHSFLALSVVLLLAGTACSADEAQAESQETPAQSPEQSSEEAEAQDSEHPQETETLPPADGSGFEPIPEFEYSVDGGSGVPAITETHIEIYRDLVAFMDEQGIAADETSLEEFGSVGNYGRAATELEYWGAGLAIPNHDSGDMGVIEVTLSSEDLGFGPEVTRDDREAFADELVRVLVETPHIDEVRDARVTIQPGDDVDQVGVSWTDENGYSSDL